MFSMNLHNLNAIAIPISNSNLYHNEDEKSRGVLALLLQSPLQHTNFEQFVLVI